MKRKLLPAIALMGVACQLSDKTIQESHTLKTANKRGISAPMSPTLNIRGTHSGIHKSKICFNSKNEVTSINIKPLLEATYHHYMESSTNNKIKIHKTGIILHPVPIKLVNPLDTKTTITNLPQNDFQPTYLPQLYESCKIGHPIGISPINVSVDKFYFYDPKPIITFDGALSPLFHLQQNDTFVLITRFQAKHHE